MKNRLKGAGLILMIGIYSYFLTVTEIDTATASESIDIQNTIVKEVQEQDQDDGMFTFLGDVFAIPSAAAEYKPSEHNTKYNQTYDFISKTTESLYKKLDREYNKESKIKILNNIIAKIKIVKKNPRVSADKYQYILGVLIDNLNDQIDIYYGNTLNTRDKTKTVFKPKDPTLDQDDMEVELDNDLNIDIKSSIEYKSYIAKGGESIDINYVMKLRGSELRKFIDGNVDNVDVLESIFFNNPIDYSNVNIDDVVLPGEVMFGMDREEIQKITQNFPDLKSYSNMGTYGISGNIKVNGNKYIVGKDTASNREAMNSMKYHFLVNGEIKRGTQKYEDFKQDYLSHEALGGLGADGFMVKLEPLPLGSNLQNKIDRNQHMTSDEIRTAIETALELEDMSDYYEIRKVRTNRGAVGKGIFKKGSTQAEFTWADTGGKIRAGNVNFVNPDSYIMNFLFSR